MMCAATAGMLGGGGGVAPTARDYVQDGLVAIFDWRENAGYDTHISNPSEWVSLVNSEHKFVFANINQYFTPSYTFGDDYLSVDKIAIWQMSPYDAFSDFGNTDNFTIESLFSFHGIPQSGYTSNGVQIVKGGGYVTPAIRLTRVVVDGDTRYGLAKSYYKRAQVVDFTPFLNKPTTVSLLGGEQQFSDFRDNYINGRVSELDANFGNSVDGWGFGYRGLQPCIGNWTTAIDTSGCIVSTDLYCIRIYSRNLSSSEIAANYAIDKARFGLP